MSEKAVSACFNFLINYLGRDFVECMRISNDILFTDLTLLEASRTAVANLIHLESQI
jgi:hypothetical protein